MPQLRGEQIQDETITSADIKDGTIASSYYVSFTATSRYLYHWRAIGQWK